MIISLIVAMGSNFVIGDNGKMPWGAPVDGKRFYNLTIGKPIIMGRKTFESVGKALPGRTNIILTRDRKYTAAECKVVHSIKGALVTARSTIEAREQTEQESEVMIIGGAEIYKLFLPQARRIYLTLIFESFKGDTFFPIKATKDWEGWQSTDREYQEPDDTYPHKLMFDALEKV
ncbi:hypothetical protein CL630_01170 [bacterium]|nr:hypothetical protein [bacterium]|tara:strand:- start:545 stop:1069 length:525 start_codon:yes stop_codon:yes gene_type:complete